METCLTMLQPENGHSTITKIWNVLQVEQADLTFHQDLGAFYACPGWRQAGSVIDLGTGNGYYLRRLAQVFPEKNYLGVDNSHDLIDIAIRETAMPDIEYDCRDLFDVTGRYDFVIMRLLLQHLRDIDRVMEKLVEITAPTGSVMIIDSHDPLRCFYPQLPLFNEFFAAYAKQQSSIGMDRQAAVKMISGIGAYPDWRITLNQCIVVPSTIPGNLAIIRRTYPLVIELIEHLGKVPFDYKRLKAEIGRWSTLEEAYAQLGVNFVVLQRK